MGIGIEAVVADHDLALVRDMGGHPGDELQVSILGTVKTTWR